MTVIKVRAWDEVNKEMVYWYIAQGTYKIELLLKPDAKLSEWMLATTLEDKNGKEIYEGDILTSAEQPKEDDERSLSVVRWSNTPYSAHFDFGVAPACYLALIIGNICENLELK